MTHVAPGDAVLLVWAMPCGTCAACVRGRPRRCAHAWEQPPRIHAADGSRLTGTLSIGSLATHTVVHAAQVVRVPDGVDLVEACLLGCGASTGIGAAVNTAGVTPGDTVAVIGLGGIGLSALLGAKLAGATRIVAIDRVASKLDTALALGATDVIDAGVDDAVTAVRSLTDTGVDVAFEATGNAPVVAQAVAMLARGGTAVAIGVPAPDSTVTLAWGDGDDRRRVPEQGDPQDHRRRRPDRRGLRGVARRARRPAARPPTARERGGAVHRRRARRPRSAPCSPAR